MVRRVTDPMQPGDRRPTSPPPAPPRLATVRQLSRAVAIPRLELSVEREAGTVRQHSCVLEGDLFRLGSHPSNDLVLRDALVSRFHCQLVRGDSGWTLADTGSLNGTFLQGVRVRDADIPTNGARLQLGGSSLIVRELGPT